MEMEVKRPVLSGGEVPELGIRQKGYGEASEKEARDMRLLGDVAVQRWLSSVPEMPTRGRSESMSSYADEGPRGDRYRQ